MQALLNMKIITIVTLILIVSVALLHNITILTKLIVGSMLFAGWIVFAIGRASLERRRAQKTRDLFSKQAEVSIPSRPEA